jgi:predicted site-specific integrase-resolvase
MLSLEKCREILQKGSNSYTKEEIEEIRTLLGSLCELEYEILKENQKKKVLLYTRVSTDEQAETGFSLANQEELLRREYVRRGFEVVDHYRDDGYSATSFERPAFQRLFSYLKQHKKQIDYVFVTNSMTI